MDESGSRRPPGLPCLLLLAALGTGVSCEDGSPVAEPPGEPLCDRSASESYLVAVAQAQAAAAPDLASGLAKLEEMRLLDAQTALPTLVASLPATEQDRYLTRQAYYAAMADYVVAWADGSWDEYRAAHDDLIDRDWTEATRAFMAQENLRLPALGVALPADVTVLSLEEICTLVADVEAVVGAEPEVHYQGLVEEVPNTAFVVLESMRKVKTTSQVLFHTVTSGFPVMDNLSAPDQPPAEELGIIPIRLVTGWALYEQDGDGNYLMDEPSESVIRDRVRNHFTDEAMFYVLNIEHWPLTGDPVEVEDTVRKLRLVTEWMHDENPNLLLGFYRLLPQRNVTGAYQGPDSEAYQDWQAHNDTVAGALEDYIDALYPSLYTLHLGNDQLTTEERWSSYAEPNLAEARRVGDGKPAIGYYAVYYHPNGTDADGFTSNPKGWELIEPELLLWQLLTARDHSEAATLYYDLGAGWSALQDADLVDALALFVALRAADRLDELQAFMAGFIADHHQALLDKLALEVQIRELENQRTLAIQDGDTVLADALTAQIDGLAAQLATAIDFWAAIQTGFN